jgi:predicted glycoside hydrolase/deacetylase ChbG (UPF0249 family)
MGAMLASLWIFLFLLASWQAPETVDERTYGQRLGWAASDRIVIFHVDDMGMSHSSNVGTIEALENGVATSCSLMMPCPWIPEAAAYLREHPEVDAGIHLTLTSEWDRYRWEPLAGASVVPGLLDSEGCFWPSVAEVVSHASADEVEVEMRAQIERAEKLGIPITHLDSHMGTLFAEPSYFERYLKLGIEKGLPILMAGGHLSHLARDMAGVGSQLRTMAHAVWNQGLPVIDDLHTASYAWKSDTELEGMIQLVRRLKPGITEVIVHASRPTDVFAKISDSGDSRLADLEALVDPRLRQVIETEGVILTTWRELKQRRDSVPD